MIRYVEVGSTQAADLCIDHESCYTSSDSVISPVFRMRAAKEKERTNQLLPRLEKIIGNATEGNGYRELWRTCW